MTKIKKINVWKNFIHSSAILYSDDIPKDSLSRILENSLENERLSNLQLVKYNKEVVKEDLTDLGITSSIGESFPWFLDDEGKNIDFRKPISLFNGVKLISNYLEKRFEMDKNLISEVKINELLKPFEEKKEVTVLELYNHVAGIYKNDNESFKVIVDKLSSGSSKKSWEDLKPLGEYGEITLNEAFLTLKDLKWDLILNNTRATINAVPFAVNFIGFSLMLRSYMKYVHNRPFEPNLTPTQRQLQQKARNRQLAIFSLVGAPLILVCLKKSSPYFKDIISINYDFSSAAQPSSQINNNSSNIVNSIFLFSYINKKIPKWIKLLFKLILLSILVLKLLGFSSILDFLYNTYYLKIYIYIICIIATIYELINLYLLHKFSKKNIKISEVLPDFIINWLKEFEIICTTKESINEFKKTYYIGISIYILIIIFITLL